MARPLASLTRQMPPLIDSIGHLLMPLCHTSEITLEIVELGVDEDLLRSSQVRFLRRCTREKTFRSFQAVDVEDQMALVRIAIDFHAGASVQIVDGYSLCDDVVTCTRSIAFVTSVGQGDREIRRRQSQQVLLGRVAMKKERVFESGRSRVIFGHACRVI